MRSGHAWGMAALLGASSAAGWSAACGGSPKAERVAHGTAETRPAAPPLSAAKARFRLALVTDLSGTLEPCGCTSHPRGGLDHLAARLRAVASDGVPTFLVVAGSTLIDRATTRATTEAGSLSTEAQWNARTIVRSLSAIQADVVAISEDEGNRVAEALLTAKELGLPILPIAERSLTELVVEKQGVKLQFVALGTMSAAPLDRIHETEGNDALVVFAPSVDVIRGVRDRLPEGSIVVTFGRDASDVSPPDNHGNAIVVRGGSQGQGIVTLECETRAPGPWVDASLWSYEQRRNELEGRISELRQKVNHWKRETSVRAEDVRRQEERLATLERELAGMRKPLRRGRFYDARWQWIERNGNGDANVKALIDGYNRSINDFNRTEYADRKPPPPAPGASRYVGASACQSCHPAAYAWWSKTPHGRAYATLQADHKEFHLNCVGCHVTGYGRPGGSTVAHTERLVHVGCESCHGPASRHVNAKTHRKEAIVRSPDEGVCRSCHTPDHSDRFNYTAYRSRLIVQGHGLPFERTLP